MSNFEGRLACVIRADGSIARGYKIEKCEFKAPNEYTITWKLPLSGTDPDDGREVKTNFAATIGSALYEPVEPGLITIGLSEDRYEMKIHTYAPNGSPKALPFHIATFRD